MRLNKLQAKQVNISCIVPVHNEEANIVAFLASLTSYLSSITAQCEVIVIDDGSTDSSIANILPLTKSGVIKVIQLSRNFGKEAALTAGLDHCLGEVAILIDADFQHPIITINEFLHFWAQDYDMVYGIRENRNHESWFKRLLTKQYYSSMQRIAKINLVPNAGDFRLLDRKVINALKACTERNRFMKGLYAWVGFKSIGVPFTVAPRQQGKSSWNFARLAELAITGITAFSNVPLRIWSLIGFAIAMCSFIAASWICIKTLVFGIDVPGYASMMVATFFFCGIQLCSIGALGEYIARIFTEVKHRPVYIVDQCVGFEVAKEQSFWYAPIANEAKNITRQPEETI